MNEYKKYYILFLFLSIFTSLLHANNPLIRNISKKSYKAGNKNWAIKEDERGFLYVANDFGLLVFDGIDWTLNSLPNKQSIKSIYVKNHNLIYTGNFENFGMWTRDTNGVLRYQSLSADIPQEDVKNNDFWQVYEKDDYIYFQSFSSIYTVGPNGISKIQGVDQFLFLMEVDDELWVQKMKGCLYKLNGTEIHKIPNTDIFNDTDVRATLPLDDGRLLIGTSNSGIFVYDKHGVTKWHTPISDVVERYELNCMLTLSNGNILIGTITNGVYEATPNGMIVSNYSTKDQLLNNTILSLFKTNNGSVWIGMDRGIANMQYISNLSYYSFDQYDIGAVYDAKFWNGYLFLCTNQGVYSIAQARMDQTQILSEMKLVDGTQGQAWSLSIIDNKLYCGHNRGIKQIISHSKALDNDIKSAGVYSIQEDKLFNQNVWLVSSYTNLLILHPNKEQIILGENGSPVKYALIDHLNNIWIKTPHKRINKYRLSENHKVVEDTFLLNNNTEAFASQNQNMFKLGGRIVISQDKQFYTYDELSGQLFENKVLNEGFNIKEPIENVKKIKDNYYWIITASSVHLIFYNGYEIQVIDQYALDIYDLSLVEKYENVSVLNDSLSLICLDNGFLIHNRREKKDVPTIEAPSIEYVRSKTNNDDNGTYLSIVDKTVKISSYESNLIEIGVHNPNAFYNNEYVQYRLSGVEEEWSSPSKTNYISFSRLPQGKYNLEVRSFGRMGETSEYSQLTLHIEPPFYKSAFAIILYILFAAFLSYAIWIFILRRHRNIHLQKIRHRERLRLKQLNSKLENDILEANSELFTRSNLILQKNKLFREIKEVLNNFYRKKNIKDLDQLYHSLSRILDTDIEDEDNWEMILVSFEQKHPNFYNNLRKISTDLTPNDLRLCICLRLNFSSKEISEIMNLSARTVDNNRSRLRKKLNLPSDTNLTDFLLTL